MAENYSPLRYPGGKSKLGNFLIQIIRANGLARPLYVEPYAGGAGAALRLLFEEFVEEIAINDADPRIRAFWDAVIKHSDQFVCRLQETPLSIEEWRKQREVYDKRDLRRPFDLGFATFYLNRTTRSGIVHNGGPIGGFDQTGNYKIDARFNRTDLSRRIQRIGAYAERIQVSGEDGLTLLQKINTRRTAPQTIVYIDPPYYTKGNELYMNHFTHADHAKLASYLRSKKRFNWVMTYDDVEQVRRLYTGYPSISFALSYSVCDHKTGNELLIYPPNIAVSRIARDSLPGIAA